MPKAQRGRKKDRNVKSSDVSSMFERFKTKLEKLTKFLKALGE